MAKGEAKAKRGKVEIAFQMGGAAEERREVDAWIDGPLFAHPGAGYREWKVSHVKTGRCVCRFFNKKRETALTAMREIRDLLDWNAVTVTPGESGKYQGITDEQKAAVKAAVEKAGGFL